MFRQDVEEKKETKLYDGFPRFFSLFEKRQNDHRPSLTKNFYRFSCIKAKHNEKYRRLRGNPKLNRALEYAFPT